MAGNSKAKRKPYKAQTIGALLEKARADRSKRYATINGNVNKRNALPLGHPSNAHKIAKTFKPIEDMLNEQEHMGSLMHDDEGIAVMRIEGEQTWAPVTVSLMDICHAFDVAARALVWGEQPPGLLAFALKLANEGKLNSDDVADARATIAWMRLRIASVSSDRWHALLAEAGVIERAAVAT